MKLIGAAVESREATAPAPPPPMECDETPPGPGDPGGLCAVLASPESPGLDGPLARVESHAVGVTLQGEGSPLACVAEGVQYHDNDRNFDAPSLSVPEVGPGVDTSGCAVVAFECDWCEGLAP